MGTMISNGTDVVSFLKEQHEEVKQLFARTLESTGEERQQSFAALRRLLAVHETAEEEIVHPAARKALPDGTSVVAARLEEEKEAKIALTKVEQLDVDSLEFETQLAQLQASVIAHAESEEREEFARLATEFEPARLQRMRKAAQFAESVAPTEPHPGVESRAANLLAGPFAAMADRAREALSPKHR